MGGPSAGHGCRLTEKLGLSTLLLLLAGSGFVGSKLWELSGEAEAESNAIPYVPPVTPDTLPAEEILVRGAQEPTEEIRTAIHSGLTISLVYKVDLRRGSATWFDRTIASTVVTATVRYDNLTRRYSVSRMVDGRTDRADFTDREDVAWAWLTDQFEKLPLFRSVSLENNGEYYVRVRAHTTPRNMAFVWPWQADDVVGLAKFTLVR